ncbi:PhoH family protein [Treponema sp.]|uniref:PhoH family protein n=1 Tax=Treponema sp. TaxID=166 RepID=UPI003F102376
MSSYTIIVPDSSMLSRVCGTNDGNLRLMESFLGVPVFARGNELSIDSGDSSLEQKFRFAVDRILDEFSSGSGVVSDEEVVRSVINGGAECSLSIAIPGGTKKVFPRTRGQSVLLQKMRTSDIVFASGPAGSGKTFIAVAEALRLLLSHKVHSLVLSRPVVEAGESLGFLPGDLQDKINPYMRPLFDSVNAVLPPDTVKRLTESGIIEIAPLAYMRGRTLSSCAIILDEAQNTTVEQMKMFLTRMGENSKVFVTGDPSQVDLPRRTPSGFLHALNLLRDVDGISTAKLTSEDVVRNGLVKKIIQAYENEER